MPQGDLVADASLERNLADLTILSSVRSPEDLATAVGLSSDRSWRMGERVGQRSGALHKYNGISYESRLPPQLGLREHLDDLIRTLYPVSNKMAKLSAER